MRRSHPPLLVLVSVSLIVAFRSLSSSVNDASASIQAHVFILDDKHLLEAFLIEDLFKRLNIPVDLMWESNYVVEDDDVCEKMNLIEDGLRHSDLVVLVAINLHIAPFQPCGYVRHKESPTRLQLIFGIWREEDEDLPEQRYATVYIDSRLGSLVYDLDEGENFWHELGPTFESAIFISINKEVHDLIVAKRDFTTLGMLEKIEKNRTKKERRGTPIAVFAILSSLPAVLYAQYFIVLLVLNKRSNWEAPRWFVAILNFMRIIKTPSESRSQIRKEDSTTKTRSTEVTQPSEGG
ncbi:hypothetical protein L596_019113 [Steinernema carpocapsae]|uniref:SEFIR domain-containing protein n=1 Tax=Steinernema carpocapsae TaxID=34508 RepID=A0A4U5N7Q5_STECR|nr:hypothetical protein L596_019113 [Steinernema carpocapsae]